jgi:tRNA nucleotidyltransferase (CCA-adding enzyme)
MAAQFYVVGGAVRDRLLGLPASDRDWVAVGTTPQALLALGYKAVGKDFPVFIHPTTGEEVALARTERKSGPGYTGFAVHAAPDVTLEEDLARRDLTINAIAQSEDGQLIDPYGGQADLTAKVLRHVSPAFVEDPVRLLRLARFAARFPSFTLAPETAELLHHMVASGEVDALVPERVWQELSRGLMAEQPSRMLQVLRSCGALARLLPEVDRLYGVPQRADYHPEIDTGVHLHMVLNRAADLQAPLPVRWACLVHDLGKGTTPPALLPKHHGHEQASAQLAQALAQRLRVPTDCRELADVVAREHGNVHRSGTLNAAAVLRLLQRCDALRRPDRFAAVLLACQCDAQGRGGWAETQADCTPVYAPAHHLPPLLQAALAVDTATVAADAASRGLAGPAVGDAVQAARVKAVEQVLAQTVSANP